MFMGVRGEAALNLHRKLEATVNPQQEQSVSVKPIPDTYSSPTPYLIVSGASDAIAWYSKALGATEHVRLVDGSALTLCWGIDFKISLTM
jgi:hypothetical protein